MKTYVRTTGILFALLTLAHLWRIAAEKPELAKDPFFLIVTAIAAGFSLWAWRLAVKVR